MTADSELRSLWAAYRCNPSKYVKVVIPGTEQYGGLSVADVAKPAFDVFGTIMKEVGYSFRESAGGTYNCRHINNDPAKPWSLHAYGIALDLNPSKNPYGSPLRFDYPQEFIVRIEALRTKTGKILFQWGGRWSTPDAMHWELDCSPADVNSGIVGYTPAPPPSTGGIVLQITRTQIKEGSKSSMGGDVAIAQGLLHAWGYGSTVGKVDGIFGNNTDSATRSFQKAKGLSSDGIIGEKTWKALES